jgi:uncharacterized membrane protein
VLTATPCTVPPALNEVVLKPDALLMACAPGAQGGDAMPAAPTFGGGLALAWASDLGAHRAPLSVLGWKENGRLWRQSLDRLPGEA